MKKFKIDQKIKKILGDTCTPIGIYLRLRDLFPNSLLLESRDYHGVEDIYTYICCDPGSSFIVNYGKLEIKLPDGTSESSVIENPLTIPDQLNDFISSFEAPKNNSPFIKSGVFGYSSFDAVRYFEDVKIKTFEDDSRSIPEIQYHLYRYLIVINHFNNVVYLIENNVGNASNSRLEEIEQLIDSQKTTTFDYKPVGEEKSNFTDAEFLEVIKQGKKHCKRGDVFQIVLSRRFSQAFEGDEFNVYRFMRSINPSPYLFYFDYGDFKIFGSSPEAQIVIKNGEAIIYPIAGTFKRTGNDSEDKALAEQLSNDPKENSEHVMLVDLARNDLSRHCKEVKVEVYKEVQYYSHVIHLVSKVSGKILGDNIIRIFADTFPAGTLSGAPKHNALKLINEYENGNRGYYGGAVGFIGFDGTLNHAITIRSVLSKNNVMYYQAGAGVVDLSIDESELQEVYNKLAAAKKAIHYTKELINE